MIPTSYTDERLDSVLSEMKPKFIQTFKANNTDDVEWLLFTFAPGRVNFIGEHVDYMGGYVCPAAVSDGCHILVGRVKHYNDKKMRFATTVGEYCELENLNEAAQKHDKTWTTFIRGALSIRLPHHKAAMGHPALKGVCMLILGTLEMGAGMSASASFGVALNHAINCLMKETYKGVPKSTSRKYTFVPRESHDELISIAKQARMIEIDFCKVNVGIMDQFISVFGQAHSFLVLDCSSLEYKCCDLRPIIGNDCGFVLIDSMIKHDLMGATGGTYNAVREDQETAQKKISEQKFAGKPFTFTELVRDAKKFTPDGDAVAFVRSCQSILTPGEFDRAIYNVEEQLRTKRFVELTDPNLNMPQEQRYKEAGDILNRAHAGLRDLMKISTPELDFIQELVNTNKDVSGGRLMGGGFGGCVIILLKKSIQKSLVDHVRAQFKERFGVENKVYPVELGDGGIVVSLHGNLSNHL